MNLRFQLFLRPSSKKRGGIGRIVIMQNAYLRPNSVDKKKNMNWLGLTYVAWLQKSMRIMPITC